MMTMAMTIGGRLVDVDGETKLGLRWESGLFSTDGLKVSRSFGLSVPCTPANDRVFMFSFSQDYPGARHSMQCSIVAGGVALNGRVYLQEYSGGRYELLFMYGDLVSAASGIMADKLPGYLVGVEESITVTGSKTDVTVGGDIPPFGFYAYVNGAAVTGSPVTGGNEVGIFPSVNLGWLIDEAAAACGYTVNYPSPANQLAHNFGLVLPTMNTVTETVCRVSGSARGGYTDVVGNLASSGLTIAARRYKRGYFNANVTCYVLQATKGLTVKYIRTDAGTNTNNVFARGMGYDFPQSWIDDHLLDYSVAEFHLNAGEWVAIVNWADMRSSFNKHYWDLQDGYTTGIDCTFKVVDDAGVVQPGETVNLADNLPEMSLAELCQAYAGLCDLSVSVNEDGKEITFTPLANIINGALIADLDNVKRTEVTRITRYIDGFARHNIVRCQSADYVAEECRFRRDYPCDNDSLDEERDIVTVPFNEGNWELNQTTGGKSAVFNDVEVGDNGHVQYRGCLSVFYRSPVGEPALHVQTINDEGVGREAAAATLNALECRVAARVPLYRFAELRPGHLVRLHGLLWTVKAATWDGDVAELELVYLKS